MAFYGLLSFLSLSTPTALHFMHKNVTIFPILVSLIFLSLLTATRRIIHALRVAWILITQVEAIKSDMISALLPLVNTLIYLSLFCLLSCQFADKTLNVYHL